MSSAAVMQQSKGWLHTAKPSRTGALHQAELTLNHQKVALYNRMRLSKLLVLYLLQRLRALPVARATTALPTVDSASVKTRCLIGQSALVVLPGSRGNLRAALTLHSHSAPTTAHHAHIISVGLVVQPNAAST
jgi:hypothetical protein